tara:strand:- start:42 stop:446 length:405 start_codon:yes stop_codon:yes gene_type:complete
MIEMYDEKKKKDDKKGTEVLDAMTKDSVKDMKKKADGCPPEDEEEKPDLRSKYAMINLIKNKLRAAGQRNPMVMMNDPMKEGTEVTIDGTTTNKTKKPDKTEKSYNITTTSSPKPTLRNKNDETTYPSGVGSGG